MIDNLKISYELDRDVNVTLGTKTGYDNDLCYNLAAIFAKVIRDSDANEEIVLEQLGSEFGHEFKKIE